MIGSPSKSIQCWVGAVGVILLLATGCSSRDESSSIAARQVFPMSAWAVASPESQGVDSRRLVELLEEMSRRSYDVDAVLLVRNGYLILEAYDAPYTPEYLHRIWSCSKSVISTVFGIAVDRGYLPGVHENVAEVFKTRAGSMEIGTRESLRFSHLLTMTTGLDARDSYLYRWEGLAAMRRSPDRITYCLSRPAVVEPGTRFDYSNEATFLLAAAVREAVGRDVPEFTREVLFDPIGVGDVSWDRGTDGLVDAWGALWMSPRDLARFAWLVANEGKWGDDQVVSKRWLGEATRGQVEAGTLQATYGYQWWISRDGLLMALGYAGQYAIIIPEEQVVAVFLSSLEDSRFAVPERLFRQYISPALADHALAENPESAQRLSELTESWARKFGGTQPIPSGLADYLNVRYPLAANPYGVVSVQFSYDSGALVYTEEYENTVISYDVGTEGRYQVSTSGGKTYAMAAAWEDSSSFRMREIGVGQAYWNEYDIMFPDTGRIRIELRHSNGPGNVLESL